VRGETVITGGTPQTLESYTGSLTVSIHCSKGFEATIVCAILGVHGYTLLTFSCSFSGLQAKISSGGFLKSTVFNLAYRL
jgi:hypothetical protein